MTDIDPGQSYPAASHIFNPMSESPTQRSEKVLVVDDDRLALEFLKDALHEAGFKLAAYNRPQEALDRLDRETFDLVVSDINMPGMNGIAFLEAVRGKGLDVPLIFLTGNDQIDTAIQAIRLGASDYIQKSKEVGESLLLAVERVLDKQRLERENQELLGQLQRQNEELENRNREKEELVEQLGRFNDELEVRVKQATLELQTANALLQKGMQELGILYEMSQAISSTFDFQGLLELLMNNTKEVLQAEASSLMLMSEDRTELEFVVAQGAQGAKVKKFTVKVGQGIAGWVAEKGESLLIPDAYADDRFNPAYDKKTGFKTRSIMCVPLKSKDEVTGVVQLINPKGSDSFTQDNLEMFKAIANQAAVAIENTRLYSRTREMADDLREALERERWVSIEKEKMGRYIPKDLVEEIARNREATLALGGQSIEASILFSDIVAFTTMSEKTTPAVILSHLNAYMTAMVAILEEHGGILDKFMGDGIMAVFKAEEDRDNHALAAVQAAIKMQEKVQELTSDWEAAELGPLRIRVGINSGNVVSGNVGAETRMDYTVIGDNVNLASRMESHGKAGQIMMHESTFEKIQGLLSPDPQKIDPIQVKGKIQPVQTYIIAANGSK